MTTRSATGVLLLTLISAPGTAWGHWSIMSQLTAREPGRIFDLRLHYEILAGQANPDEALRVCFWLERHQGNRYAPVTGRICRSFTLKPNDWRSFSYAVDTLPWLEDRRPGGKLPAGQYRARALIESDVNFVVRFFTGAGQEQKVLPFTVAAQNPDLIARGKYLVEVGANCGECHTPVTATGEPDETYHLAGHVAGRPVPSNTAFKAFHGEGVTYARNLTPDRATGLGGWTKEEFRRALKEGITKGGRPLRPPMPWERFRKMFTDQDIDAIWSYLQSLPPVRNRVPDAVGSPR